MHPFRSAGALRDLDTQKKKKKKLEKFVVVFRVVANKLPRRILRNVDLWRETRNKLGSHNRGPQMVILDRKFENHIPNYHKKSDQGNSSD